MAKPAPRRGAHKGSGEARAKALDRAPNEARGKRLVKRDTLTRGLILDLLTNEIHRLKSSTGRGLFEIGTRLVRILDEDLWQARGYTSFEDYLERGVSFSRSTGYKLMRVARRFKKDVAERYGIEKLDLGLRYLEAQAPRNKTPDPLNAEVRLRDKDGRFIVVAFHDASPAQLRSALRLRVRDKRVRRVLPDRFRVLDELLQRTLALEPRSRRRQLVKIRTSSTGHQTVTFQDIPVGGLERFCEALRQVLKDKSRDR
jgi:hypothetical protein